MNYTDDDGYFEFDNVLENRTYQVLVVASGYDTYMGQVVVGDEDIEMGDLMLTWIDPYPFHLLATESMDQQSVTLTWSLGTGDCIEFRYDDGMITGQLGYQSGSDDVRLGAAHYHDAQIEEITWYLTDVFGPHNAVDIYIYGLDEDGMPDSGNELFSETGVENADEEWNTFSLPVPILAPEGFYVGLNYPEGFLALGTDDGNGEPYEYIDGTQWVTNAASENDWHTPSELEYPYNFAIRANGLDFGEIEHRTARTLAKGAMPDAPLYIDGYTMPETASLRTDRTTYLYFYRLLEGDESNPENWTLLGEGEYDYPDTSFVDETWENAEWGFHRWAILYYPEADVAFSNTLPRIWSPHVEINVTTNSGDSPEGAYVVLENIDGNEDHVYEGYVPASGTLFLPAVWLGVYTLNVYLPRFDDYEQHNLIIDDMEIDEIDVVLTETLLPVTSGYLEIDGSGFRLYWERPSLPSEIIHEDFEDGTVPEDWILLDRDNDGYCWEIISTHDRIQGEYAIASASYLIDIGALTPDNWLISPQFEIEAEADLSFLICAESWDWFEEHYAVRLSTSGTDPEDFTETLYEETLSDNEWHEVLIELDSYAGNECHIAFNHCNCTNMYLLVLDVIDIVCEGESVLMPATRNDCKATRESSCRSDRSLLGYRITYNGTTIVELQEETELFYSPPPGPYHYFGIFAVYATGEAEGYYTGFGDADENTIPKVTTNLLGNSPNPFNPETRIDFSIASDSRVGIEVFNTRGQRVKIITDTRYEKGEHHVLWRGDDDAGHSVSSGIYFYRMTVDGKSVGVKKMLMLK